MRTIRLNLARCGSKEQVHRYLKIQFQLPEYYGENLDALYDCLTDIAEDTEIVFEESEDDFACGAAAEPLPGGEDAGGRMRKFLKAVRRVIEDAAAENSHLYL